MEAVKQETEQPILSKELKKDKKLELGNDIGRSDRDFKEIIANSILTLSAQVKKKFGMFFMKRMMNQKTQECNN